MAKLLQNLTTPPSAAFNLFQLQHLLAYHSIWPLPACLLLPECNQKASVVSTVQSRSVVNEDPAIACARGRARYHDGSDQYGAVNIDKLDLATAKSTRLPLGLKQTLNPCQGTATPIILALANAAG
jgi:hypothetical protein